jgi:hypothetical protein
MLIPNIDLSGSFHPAINTLNSWPVEIKHWRQLALSISGHPLAAHGISDTWRAAKAMKLAVLQQAR